MSGLDGHQLHLAGEKRSLDDNELDVSRLRQEVEPWLAAVIQSEHLALLVGNGLSLAVANAAGVGGVTMDRAKFDAPESESVDRHAEELARESQRGEPNIEDQLHAALKLVGGLEVLGDARAAAWRGAVERVLDSFVEKVTAAERDIAGVLASADDEKGHAARSLLTTFLLSFASRTASRDRLNVFTTNYDRLLEFGCDLVGLRPLDRFVGTLVPTFRASRLDVDYHYSPPGIRGEPRYLEGVVRLTKLHGSIDWRFVSRQLLRIPLPFGPSAELVKASSTDLYQSLIIYPNPAKDVETLEYPYAELFRDFAASLCRPNSALVVYGYGFGDDHINRVIEDMLTIPSTHVVVIAYADAGGRLARFVERVGRESQLTLLIGSHFGDLETLVQNYLPKPLRDNITARKAALVGRQAAEGDRKGLDGPNER